jgi:hypothetical protein
MLARDLWKLLNNAISKAVLIGHLGECGQSVQELVVAASREGSANALIRKAVKPTASYVWEKLRSL